MISYEKDNKILPTYTWVYYARVINRRCDDWLAHSD